MQPIAIEGLATGMIFAVAGSLIKAMAAVRSRKLTHWERHTIHDSHRRVIEQKRVTDQAPQPLLDRPQVGCLSQPGRASYSRHFRKEMRVVTAEVVKDFLILAESQIGSYQFHGDHLAIGQFGHRPPLAQAFSFRCPWQHLVNQTETCDNKIVQAHGVPPQKLAILLRKVDSMSLTFGKKTCTSG